MKLSPVPKEVRLFILIEQAFRIAAGLQEQGRAADADQLYQFILAIKPDHFGSLFQLATIRARADQLEVAMALFRQAAAVDPNSADAMAGLGAVLAVDGRRDEAVVCYEKALSIDANHAGARHALGATLHALGRTAQAIPLFERAIEIRPDYAEAHFGFANLLQGVNRLPEAIAHYEQVIALQPRRVEAYNQLGTLLARLGHCEEAVAQFENALAIDEAGTADQRVLQTHLNLAYLKKFTADDPRLQRLEEIAGDIATLPAEDRIPLHFALGKAYDDLNQPERAFGHLREANAMRRRTIDYDEKCVLGRFERIATNFNRDLMNQKSGSGDDSPAPVFVVGMPGSGITLVEQILASHSQILAAGETDAFARALAPLRRAESTGGEDPDMIAAMTPENLRELGSRYLDAIKSQAPSAHRIVNRSSINVMSLGLIHLALPSARFIHVRRDPLDSCFSCFARMFAGDRPFAHELGELGRYHRAYADLMAHWHAVLPQGVMIDIAYEKLVGDIEGQSRAMIDHCNLQWEDACLSFNRTERPVRTASAVQARTPVYTTSIGRSRRYQSFLQPLAEALNLSTAATRDPEHASV